MRRENRIQRARRTWRAYCQRDGRQIERQLRDAPAPCCPCCGDILEARPQTRFSEHLPLGAHGYDLDCRDCRRFWCVVRHTARSVRLLRMKRFVAAVLATPSRAGRERNPQQVIAV